MKSKVNLKGCFAIVVIFVVVVGIGRLSQAVSLKFTQTVDDSYDDNNSQKSGSNVVLDGYYGSDYEIFIAGLLPTIYVDADATGGANNGTNWENAYLYLPDALDDPCLVSGGEILVAAGTYRPDEDTANPGGSGDRKMAFRLKDGVTIKGGYAGFGEPNPDARDVELYKTILSGDLDANDVQVSDPYDLQDEPTRADNSYHVVIGSGTESTAVIDGFTITGGNANGSASEGSGGGMFNYEGNPTVTNCILSSNSANSYGGGMYNYKKSSPIVTNCILTGNYALYGGSIYNNNDSSPTVTNCMFEDNGATSYGGGMYNRNDSNSTVINCTFTGNSAYSGGGMYNMYSRPNVTDCTFTGNSGGGMYNYDSSSIVTDCTFTGNSSSSGGGMRNYKNSPTVTNCTFSGNTSGFGGGISNSDSSPTVTGCTFTDNSGDSQGGGMYNGDSSNPTVTNCTFTDNSTNFGGGGMHNNRYSNPIVRDCMFTGNSAHYYGGGMYNYDDSNSTVINCTFTENKARVSGGGLCNRYSSSPTVTNCTFSSNTASGGGGMYNQVDSNSTVTNCIFWGDTPNEIHNSGSNPTVAYCDVQGGWGDPNDPNNTNIDADPCFVDVNNPDPNLWNFHLKSTSVCIDEGNNSAVGLAVTDRDGHPRIIDGDCDETAVVDMGSYEFNYAYMGDLDYNCRVDFFDFSLLAGFWQKQKIEQDYNYDGLVNFYDWAYFADFWDGDYYELSLFLDQWLTQTAAFVDIAPQSGDNIVDWQDLGKLCENWLVGVE